MSIKNITFISLNYAPEDSAIGLYSTQWAEFLNEAGYNVNVITGFPYYPKWEISKDYRVKRAFLREQNNGIEIYRYKQYVPKKPTFFKRIIHLSDFTIGSFINLFKVKECDLVISVVPFTTSILLGYALKKKLGAKVWVHIQDFEFEAAFETGLGKKKTILFALLSKLERWLFTKADISSTISKSMLLHLSRKTGSEKFFLPNWIDSEKINPENHTIHPYLKTDRFKLLYSGNIGDKQDWETFVRFCGDIDQKKYDVIIVGDGSKKEWLLARIQKFRNVYFYPTVPFEELSSLLCSTDAHLLFQKPSVVDTVMPSKVLGMMASTKPSIVIGNLKSEVKTIFDISKAGFYFSKYSSNVIDCLNVISENEELYVANGKKCREYVIEHFSKEKILHKMLVKLKNL